MINDDEMGKRRPSPTIVKHLADTLDSNLDPFMETEGESRAGVDSTLVAMFLKMSPEERLRANDSAVRSVSELRNAYGSIETAGGVKSRLQGHG